jgi:hypothetical protein
VNKLESLVKVAAKTLHCQGLCTLYKIPEEMKQTPCDFFGHDREGRVIMIECKILNKPSLPCGGRSGVKAHQLGALVHCSQTGGHAFVLWQHGVDVALLPMRIVQRMLMDRMSLPWDRIDRVFVREASPKGVAELLALRFDVP